MKKFPVDPEFEKFLVSLKAQPEADKAKIRAELLAHASRTTAKE